MRILKAAGSAHELIYTISAVIKAVMRLLRLNVMLINTQDHFSVQQGNTKTAREGARHGEEDQLKWGRCFPVFATN